MNWNLGQLECDFCKARFNCSIGLSNKETIQTFGFCCQNCGGMLSIVVDPHESSNYELINISRSNNSEKIMIDLKSIRLHLDFPTFISDCWLPLSPFTLSALGSKHGYSIEHFKEITNELNFYSKNILKLKSLFVFYKNKNLKELLTTSRSLLRDDFEKIIGVDEEYISNISMLNYYTTREIELVFYKTLLSISIPLNMGDIPDYEINAISSYLSGMKKDALCNFHSYLSQYEHLQNSAKTTNSIYSNIYSNEEFFRPSIYLSDYSSIEFKNQMSPLRLASEKIEIILSIYKDLTEVISKQYTLIVGLENIKKRNNHNSFIKNSIRLKTKTIPINNIVDFSNLDLGLKSRLMDGCYYHDEIKKVSHKIRNSIAHNNWEYDEQKQGITFFQNRGIDKSKGEKPVYKTILEINSDIIDLFRLMHKLNIIHYLFNYFWGCADWSEEN